MSGIITLTTDFGLKSVYAGVMKGVLLDLWPAARVVDLTHLISPQNILEGAFLLNSAYPYFPAGTVHVAVVDPGVGTDRRAVVLRAPQVGYFVGPDNGLFSYIIEAYPGLEARQITNTGWFRPQVSSTFHGRDIFAPVAARLARGDRFEEVGPVLEAGSLQRLAEIQPEWETGETGRWLSGRIVHVDDFGNLVTNLRRELFAGYDRAGLERVRIEVENIVQLQGILETYGQAQPGRLIALFGSSGYLEVARVNGRADRLEDGSTGFKPGAVVRVQPDQQRKN